MSFAILFYIARITERLACDIPLDIIPPFCYFLYYYNKRRLSTMSQNNFTEKQALINRYLSGESVSCILEDDVLPGEIFLHEGLLQDWLLGPCRSDTCFHCGDHAYRKATAGFLMCHFHARTTLIEALDIRSGICDNIAVELRSFKAIK